MNNSCSRGRVGSPSRCCRAPAVSSRAKRSAIAAVCVIMMAGTAWAEDPYEIAWMRQLGTSGYDSSWSVAVDASGNAYISGSTHGSLGGPNAGGNDAFLSKYDAAGNLLWTRQFGTSNTDISRSVVVDTAGNAYISGYSGGSLGGAKLEL